MPDDPNNPFGYVPPSKGGDWEDYQHVQPYEGVFNNPKYPNFDVTNEEQYNAVYDYQQDSYNESVSVVQRLGRQYTDQGFDIQKDSATGDYFVVRPEGTREGSKKVYQNENGYGDIEGETLVDADGKRYKLTTEMVKTEGGRFLDPNLNAALRNAEKNGNLANSPKVKFGETSRFGSSGSGSSGSGSGSGGSSGGAVRSYLDIEADKTAESTRQYNDFIKRVEDIYGIQNAERDIQKQDRDWAFDGDKHNVEMESAARKGLIGSEMYTFGAAARPGNLSRNNDGQRLSDMIRSTIPSEIPSDYRLNDAVGLPGAHGTDYDKLYGSMSDFGPIGGYADGSVLPSMSPAQPPAPQLPGPRSTMPAPVDQELSWMVGVPLFKGGIFGGDAGRLPFGTGRGR